MRIQPAPLVLLLIFAVFTRTSPAQIVFDDGSHHTITDSYANELFVVTNHTTVIHRGEITWLDPARMTVDDPVFSFAVSEGSALIVEGGTIERRGGNLGSWPREGLTFSDSSFIINGGDIEADRISSNNSELFVAGGKLRMYFSTDYTDMGGAYFHDSVFQVTGGEVEGDVAGCCDEQSNGITLTGTTVAEISGGRVWMLSHNGPMVAVVLEGKELRLSDGEIIGVADDVTLGVAVSGSQAEFVMSGGRVTGSDGVAVSGRQAGFVMKGGQVQARREGVSISGSQAEFRMTGGLVHGTEDGHIVTGIAADKGMVDVSSGGVTLIAGRESTTFFLASGRSRVVVRGGEFRGERMPRSSETDHTLFEATGNGKMTVSGGQYLGELDVLGVRAADTAEVVIIGSDFNLPISSAIQESNGVITGTLRDGNPFSWSFERDESATIRLSWAGDYNGDGVIDVADVDLQAIAMKEPNPDLATFGENNDHSVDINDRIIWVHDRAHTWVGDADLNGEFNSSDLTNVFQAGQYEDGIAMNSGWAEGDWNGDGDFDSSDLVAAFSDGGYDQGPGIGVNAVPEPSSLAMLIIGGIGIAIRRRLVVA